MSRIGVYGGSFNPPHVGHVLAASEMIRLLNLDLLYIIPAGLPPHKALAENSPPAQERLQLCKSAFSALPSTEVLDIEICRDGPSYTVDTLEALRRKHPDSELFLLMGTDMLLSFSQWHAPDRIMELAALAVLRRSKVGKKQAAALQSAAEQAELQFGGKVLLLDNACLEISSTQARNLIAMDCFRGVVPDSIAAQIRANAYYGYGTNRKNLSFEELSAASLALHDPVRVPHAIGCSDTAAALAERFGANVTDARRAGILHDVTKALGPAAQFCVCDRYAVALTASERSNPKLLHAKTGAVIAREVFGENEAVCDAICWHTTGHGQMTLLEKIIYLADYIEPNRDFPGVETLRKYAQTDLNAAVFAGVDLSLRHLQARGRPIDENTMEAWTDLSKYREELQ